MSKKDSVNVSAIGSPGREEELILGGIPVVCVHVLGGEVH